MSDINGGRAPGLAPVIPLFGRDGVPSERHPAHAAHMRNNLANAASGGEGRREDAASEVEPRREPPKLRALRDVTVAFGVQSSAQAESGDEPAPVGGADDAGSKGDAEAAHAAATTLLLRKLRSRAYSVAEARTFLRGAGVTPDTAAVVVDDFLDRGYLNDTALAEQLVHTGFDRKGMGRVALSRLLAQRGLSRDAIAQALTELPNDDEERALEFARGKARSLARLDPEVALRRLHGQLARRGYGGSVAMSAARTALREATFGAGASTVRFIGADEE